jgi:hypothetical protein
VVKNQPGIEKAKKSSGPITQKNINTAVPANKSRLNDERVGKNHRGIRLLWRIRCAASVRAFCARTMNELYEKEKGKLKQCKNILCCILKRGFVMSP